mmetsp:Transcript_40776/g.89120  ORF Transcript_40776/g.89120 Transcript_40776/m.89120 type:complete len:222 (+) Transcript_40776:84-749(+)
MTAACCRAGVGVAASSGGRAGDSAAVTQGSSRRALLALCSPSSLLGRPATIWALASAPRWFSTAGGALALRDPAELPAGGRRAGVLDAKAPAAAWPHRRECGETRPAAPLLARRSASSLPTSPEWPLTCLSSTLLFSFTCFRICCTRAARARFVCALFRPSAMLAAYSESKWMTTGVAGSPGASSKAQRSASPMAESSPVLLEPTSAPRLNGDAWSMTTGP